ncbi:MAG: hypothetical protein AAFN74_14545 [Myxococcota bacterium]
MARKRSGGRGGRSKAYRTPAFRVTCKGCGAQQTIPVRPDPSIDLYCVECTSKSNAAKAEAAANAG